MIDHGCLWLIISPNPDTSDISSLCFTLSAISGPMTTCQDLNFEGSGDGLRGREFSAEFEHLKKGLTQS